MWPVYDVWVVGVYVFCLRPCSVFVGCVFYVYVWTYFTELCNMKAEKTVGCNVWPNWGGGGYKGGGYIKGTPSIPETYLSSSVAWGLNLRVG